MANKVGSALIVTGTAGFTAIQIQASVAWVAAGCPTPMPDAVVSLLTVIILVLAHTMQKYLSKRFGFDIDDSDNSTTEVPVDSQPQPTVKS